MLSTKQMLHFLSDKFDKGVEIYVNPHRVLQREGIEEYLASEGKEVDDIDAGIFEQMAETDTLVQVVVNNRAGDRWVFFGVDLDQVVKEAFDDCKSKDANAWVKEADVDALIHDRQLGQITW